MIQELILFTLREAALLCENQPEASHLPVIMFSQAKGSWPLPHGVWLVVFFHECGRRVGGVPRSSLKGKETRRDEGEKNTSNTKTSKKPPNPKQETETRSHNSPSSKRVSSVPG